MEHFLQFLKDEIESVKKSNRYRFLREISSKPDRFITVNGKRVLNLCSNNYLGLAGHPKLIEAEINTAKEFGAGSTGSRLISGTTSLHLELERRVALLKKTEKAIIFNTGYMANLGVLYALIGSNDAIFSDELNHASIIDASRLSRGKVFVYRHNDMEHLETLLKSGKNFNKKIVVTDSVFSMDGDIAKLPDIVFLAGKYSGIVMTDDAHATGVLGENGGGSGEYFRLSDKIHIQMGTFGKALGTFGAYIAGCKELIDFLINKSRPLIYTTALPPGILGATIAAIDIVSSEEGKRRRRLLMLKSDKLRKLLNDSAIDTFGSKTQIIPIFVGDEKVAMMLTSKLLENGIFVQGIRPPTVAPGKCRLRVSMTIPTDIDNNSE